MLNYIIGFGIGFAAHTGLSRIQATWVRRLCYFGSWFVMYGALILIGAALAEAAGRSINGPTAASLANGMTIGLVISAFTGAKRK